MKNISIVNYGVGNILSLKRALEHCGAQVTIASTAREINNAERIVVPGVGAFNNCIEKLIKNGLKEALIKFAQLKKPYLGICVGMQMLLENSTEFGDHNGLSILNGKVVKINSIGIDNQSHKIPFIGWKSLEKTKNNPLLKNINPNEKVYFIHSYKAELKNENVLAQYDYDGIKIPAIVGSHPVFGTQFHPEKSRSTGLKIISNFLNEV